MKSRATAERVAPRLGVIASIALHLGLVAALFVSFSKKLDIPTDATPLVPVDLVTVGEETNIAPMVKQEDATPPPEPAMVEPEPQPEIAPPQFEIAPDVKPIPKEKPKPKPEEKFSIDDIQKLLSKKKPTNVKIGARTIQGVGAQTGMTADLVAILQSQMYRCWTRPDYGPHPERLIVSYELFLNRDGSIAQAPQLTPESAAAVAGDPYMRAAADAGRRAIYQCSPYRLPPDKYNVWRDIVFTFGPRSPVEQ
jgi:hypothetical protein